MKLSSFPTLGWILASGVLGSGLTILLQQWFRKRFGQPKIECFFFSPLDIHFTTMTFPCGKLACPMCSFTSLCKVLRSTKSELDICMYLLTENEISKIIVALHKKGVKIRVITDKQMSEDSQRCKTGYLLKYQIPVKYVASRGMMHNKFFIIDRKSVVTGSCNWTQNALMSNYENMVLINDKEIAESYVRYFNSLWLCEKFL